MRFRGPRGLVEMGSAVSQALVPQRLTAEAGRFRAVVTAVGLGEVRAVRAAAAPLRAVRAVPRGSDGSLFVLLGLGARGEITHAGGRAPVDPGHDRGGDRGAGAAPGSGVGGSRDADLAVAEAAFARMTPEPLARTAEPVDVAGFDGLPIPRSFLHAVDDNAFPAHEFTWHPGQSRRLGRFRLVRMAGGHEVLFTDPAGLAARLVEAGRD